MFNLRHWNNVQVFEGENPDVKKFVFEKNDACVEAVLYKYGSYTKRTVLCISTQCGCPVGCVFCGTGKKFIRNLTSGEITEQVEYVIEQIEREIYSEIPDLSHDGCLNLDCNKLQIMFMSMGEPMLNWHNVERSIKALNLCYSNADLLISTMGVDDDEVFGKIIKLSKEIDKIGLQFSVHAISEYKRDILIPFDKRMDLLKLRDAGLMWWKATGRQVYLNFCINEDGLSRWSKNRIAEIFSPIPFALTFSVICENEDGKVKDTLSKDLETSAISGVVEHFVKKGYNVRAFDPAGQDDIGGGCGQLWYVQKWMKDKKNN